MKTTNTRKKGRHQSSLYSYRMKNYIKNKEENKLAVNQTQQKFAKSFKKVPHTFSEDGLLRFNDKVMVLNKATEGYLVFDMGDKIAAHDEAYANTTSKKATAPSARNIFVLTRAEEDDDFVGNVIHYGQKVRIQANKYITGKNLYLHSCQISPLNYARFSRHQEVCMHIKKIYNTVWVVEDLNPLTRSENHGKPVPANAGIIIKHAATGHLLASDIVDYRNDFGLEYEVCVHNFSTKNKSQNLALEASGNISGETPTKFQMDQNIWMFCTSNDPKDAEEIEGELTYTIDDILAEIKSKLLQRGSYGIRGLARIFKILDNDGGRKLDLKEFQDGLLDYGIPLTDEQAKLVMEKFDTNKDGHVDFNEFLRYLKGDINKFRENLIRLAYEKLDINSDGQVTLDDIAKIYDASHHPDVLSGKKTREEVYSEFMSQWDTQIADGIVTFDEFMEYFKDVSASIDSDEYFEVMIRNAWKI